MDGSGDRVYLITFFSWIPLALLARAHRGRPPARALWIASAATLALCVWLLYLEFIWSRRVTAPIRVDLLLLIPAATLTFSAVGVWALRMPGTMSRAASLMLLALSVPTLVVFARGTWTSSRALARLNTRPALIFEAQFRNAATFRNFFGAIDSSGEPRAGHFRAEDPNGVATRVIVNDRAHLWLMFKCEPHVECVHAEADLDGTRFPGSFIGHPPAGLPAEIAVSQWNRDRITLSLYRGSSQTFVRTPVQFAAAVAAAETVTYVGAFAQTRIDRDDAYLVQIWLWRSGERWLAYYVRRNARCGTTADFVSATAYDGRHESDRIWFTPAAASDSPERFAIASPVSDAAVRLEGQIIYGSHPLEPLALTRRSVVRFPAYESAPLVSFEATVDWLKTVSMGESASWKADCGGGA